jgi:FHS family L-fucose permease-like MFS transporter
MKNSRAVRQFPLEPVAEGPSKPSLSLVPAPPPRPAPLLWVMYFAYFTFGLTGVVGTLTPDIIADFHLTRAAAGLIGTFTFLSVALFAMPSGLLADRLGARRVILAGVGLMALGCLMLSQAQSYPLVLAMVFAIGTGVTMLQTSGSPMIQQLDAPQNYHRNLTFAVAGCTFAAFLSIFSLAYLRGTGHPWQSYYLLFAVVCLVLLGFLSQSTFPARAANAEGIHLEQIGKLLRNPILITYGLGVYLYSMAEIGIYFWIPKFFEDVHGVPAAVSSATATTVMGRVFPSLPAFVYALFLGMTGVGRVLGGSMLKRFGTVRVLRVCVVMTLASLLAATFGSKMFTVIGFAACGFFISVVYPLIYTATINSFDKYQGTISGLLCTSYIAAAAVPPFQGWVADHIGMRVAMLVPAVCLTYVIGLAMFGRAKYD